LYIIFSFKKIDNDPKSAYLDAQTFSKPRKRRYFLILKEISIALSFLKTDHD